MGKPKNSNKGFEPVLKKYEISEKNWRCENIRANNFEFKAADCAVKEEIAKALKKKIINRTTVKKLEHYPLLSRAVFLGCNHIVEQLLTAGENPNIKTLDGYSPLMLAVYTNNTEAFKTLWNHAEINNNQEFNHANSQGHTLLTLAVQYGNVDHVKRLLSIAGIDLDKRINSGKTALMLAAVGGHKEIVQHLLGARCNVLLEDKTGATALCYAIAKKNREIIALMHDSMNEVLREEYVQRRILLLHTLRFDSNTSNLSKTLILRTIWEIRHHMKNGVALLCQYKVFSGLYSFANSHQTDAELLCIIFHLSASLMYSNTEHFNCYVKCDLVDHFVDAKAADFSLRHLSNSNNSITSMQSRASAFLPIHVMAETVSGQMWLQDNFAEIKSHVPWFKSVMPFLKCLFKGEEIKVKIMFERFESSVIKIAKNLEVLAARIKLKNHEHQPPLKIESKKQIENNCKNSSSNVSVCNSKVYSKIKTVMFDAKKIKLESTVNAKSQKPCRLEHEFKKKYLFTRPLNHIKHVLSGNLSSLNLKSVLPDQNSTGKEPKKMSVSENERERENIRVVEVTKVNKSASNTGEQDVNPCETCSMSDSASKKLCPCITVAPYEMTQILDFNDKHRHIDCHKQKLLPFYAQFCNSYSEFKKHYFSFAQMPWYLHKLHSCISTFFPLLKTMPIADKHFHLTEFINLGICSFQNKGVEKCNWLLGKQLVANLKQNISCEIQQYCICGSEIFCPPVTSNLCKLTTSYATDSANAAISEIDCVSYQPAHHDKALENKNIPLTSIALTCLKNETNPSCSTIGNPHDFLENPIENYSEFEKNINCKKHFKTLSEGKQTICSTGNSKSEMKVLQVFALKKKSCVRSEEKLSNNREFHSGLIKEINSKKHFSFRSTFSVSHLMQFDGSVLKDTMQTKAKILPGPYLPFILKVHDEVCHSDQVTEVKQNAVTYPNNLENVTNLWKTESSVDLSFNSTEAVFADSNYDTGLAPSQAVLNDSLISFHTQYDFQMEKENVNISNCHNTFENMNTTENSIEQPSKLNFHYGKGFILPDFTEEKHDLHSFQTKAHINDSEIQGMKNDRENLTKRKDKRCETKHSACLPFLNCKVKSKWYKLLLHLQISSVTFLCLKSLIGEVRFSSEPEYTLKAEKNGGPHNLHVGLLKNSIPIVIHQLKTTISNYKQIAGSILKMKWVNHPNLVFIHDIIICSSSLNVYIVLDLCEFTLTEYLKMQKCGPNHSGHTNHKNLVVQLIDAVKYLHNRKVVHGHLKPSNVMVTDDHQLKVTDFYWIGFSSQVHEKLNVLVSDAYWRNQESQKPSLETGEITTMAGDIQMTGMLVHFILTGGKYYNESHHCQYFNSGFEGSPSCIPLEIEAEDLIKQMLKENPADRPSIQSVAKHPCLWNAEKRFQFLLQVGKKIDFFVRKPTKVAEMLNKSCLEAVDWTYHVDEKVLDFLHEFSGKVYRDNFADFLHFIVDLDKTYKYMSNNLQGLLRSPMRYILCTFPTMLMSVYDVVRQSIILQRQMDLQTFF